MAVFGREVFGLLSESLKSTNEQYINCAFEVFGMMSRDKCELLDNAMVEEHLMPYLMNRIADSGCSIESKMVCFITLGEVSLNHLPVMLKWIREIFEKFKQGLEAAYQMLCEKVVVKLTLGPACSGNRSRHHVQAHRVPPLHRPCPVREQPHE